MKVVIPVLNTVNFLAIFLILYFLNTDSLITVGIATLVGLVIGLLVKVIFLKERRGPRVNRPAQKVSAKLLIIPSALLLILIALFAVYMAGHNPFAIEGHTTKEEVQTEDVAAEIIEEEPEIVYAGRCEEREFKREYNTEAQAYTAVEDWVRVGFKCNDINDCFDQLDESGKTYDPDNIQCNTE